MRVATTFLLTGLAAAPAAAADMTVSVEIPRLSVAEYHRPYVAMWVEKPDQSVATNLAVWYDFDMKDNEGTKWLRDLRTWWRKAGRELDFPADGITGATRAPGTHKQSFNAARLKGLAPGSYNLVVEAAREVGGREIVRVPFQWPPKKRATAGAKGTSELGAVSLDIKP
jgi:hypothetical protein